MKPLSRRTYAIAAIALAAVIFVAVNIFVDAAFTTAQIDLTQSGQFTLSQGTRNVIAKLKEPVTLKFYYSKKVAADYATTQSYAKRVRDLLAEYAAMSHGKIILEDVDPEPFTPQEDQATAAGLTGAATDSGDVVYFGLVGTNQIDGKQVIPYFTTEREAYLEYDLSSLIYRLSEPKKPTLGIITSLPLETGPGGMAAMMQGTAQPFTAYSELAQSYNTKTIDPNFTAIPAGIDVLMIAHPPVLTGPQLLAIDQFVLRGGHALVFVDPLSEVSQQGAGQDPRGAPSPSSDLGILFAAWGIGFDPDKIVGDRELAQRVQTSGDPRNPTAAYPIWLHLTADNFDDKDPITANLQTLNLASVGALTPLKKATTHFLTLVASSKQAALLDREQVQYNGRPEALMAAIIPTGIEYAIAVRVTGEAHTAFPNQAAVKAGKINVVVMADSDIFDDRFWVHTESALGRRVAAPFADNGAFILNAVENLSGSDDLISLRTRATSDRPFTVVRALQAQAQAQYQQTAEALQARLASAQQRLKELQAGDSTNGKTPTSAGLTPEQSAEIERFKRELIETRAELREVQHNLRKDIDVLGDVLAFINIALVPLIVTALALFLGWLRRRKRRRAQTRVMGAAP